MSAGEVPAELAAEMRRVIRHFQRYTPQQRALRASSHRLGYRQRQAVGEYYYTHPDAPACYDTRRGAAAAALRRRGR